MRTELTDVERDVLSLLHGNPGGMTAGYVGSALWGRPHRLPQHWARPAGRVLRRLETRGLCQVRYNRAWLRMEWAITHQGYLALQPEEPDWKELARRRELATDDD